MSNGETKIENYTTEICPWGDHPCGIYKNWASQQEGKEQIDIIHKTKEGYYCFAKIAMTNPNALGGVEIKPGLAKRLKDKDAPCSWIEHKNEVYKQGILIEKLYQMIASKLKPQKSSTKPVQSSTTQKGV